jgi:hypothetical protein
VKKKTGRGVGRAGCPAKEQGLSLTGPGGLLKQLTKTVLESRVALIQQTQSLGAYGTPIDKMFLGSAGRNI